jgi:hypothetical protein
MVTSVTFDANALARLKEHCEVLSALEEGRIKGYFSQTYYSLEGIQKKHRANVLARTDITSHSSSPNKEALTISIIARHYRPSLDDKYKRAVDEALGLGLRALRGPPRFVIDGLTVRDPDQSFYVVECIEQMRAHREKKGRRGCRRH